MIIVLRNLIFLFSFICLGSSQSIPKHGHRLVGGWMPKDIDYEPAKDNAKYAAKLINDQSNDMYFQNLIHIHDVKSQVVGGVKYNITFDMSKTICRKNEIDSDKPEQCVPDRNATIKRCYAVVYERPWESKRQLLDHKCNNHLSYSEYFNDTNIAREQEYQQNRKMNLL
ncbi:cystatin-1 [Tetranychus urticae]|nr:cystatin-1 [Tetranychus urticae]